MTNTLPTPAAMPELPKALLLNGFQNSTCELEDGYTADQMHAYAIEYAAALEASRLAGLVEAARDEPTVEMTRAAARWLTNLHLMRPIDRTNAINDAYRAMRAVAKGQAS